MTAKLYFTKNGQDITEGLELRNGKSNASGWSSYEVWLTERGGETMVEYKIGDLCCGEPINLIDTFGFRVEKSEG
jgi:hypothetical protein